MAGLAMHQVVTKALVGELSSQSSDASQSHDKLMLQAIRPRVVGHGPEVHLRHMKINSFGKLFAVRGTIIRAGNSQVCIIYEFVTTAN